MHFDDQLDKEFLQERSKNVNKTKYVDDKFTQNISLND